MDQARRTAVLALVRQEESGYANLVLGSFLEQQTLSSRDKAFVSAVFYGVTERLITLDWCLSRCLSRPLHKLDAQVRAILRSGLYQAAYMNIPPRAAVNESVNLCRGLKKTSASGLVNAVLRKAMEQDPRKAQFKTPAERLSVLYSVGQPIVKLLQKQYPQECESILQAFGNPPRHTLLRANSLKVDVSELCDRLAQQGTPAQPGPVPGSVQADFAGSPAAGEAFAQGLYHVQGAASQLAALNLGTQPGQKVLDLCAAPGGKTLTLAQCMQNTGTLISCDAVQSRLSLIEGALSRCGIANTTVLCNDASVHNAQLEGADRVLCDVPCSGLGIIAKKPDIRYKTMEQVEQLHALQAEILACGASYLKSGGRLVYSTCTIDQRENQQVVEAFLQIHPEFHLVEPEFTLPGARIHNHMMTFLPGESGPDGFFIAVLEKA